MKMLRVVAQIMLVLSVAACVPQAPTIGATDRPEEPRLVLKASSFEALEGWAGHSPLPAYAALQASCGVILGRMPGEPMGGHGAYGSVSDWAEPCRAVVERSPGSDKEARILLETLFTPVRAMNGREERGLFTGYYEPELRGSLQRSTRYRTPLHQRPSDLVEVDLGQFRPQMRGERVVGRVVGGRLVPFASRREIVEKGLGSKAQPLVFVDDAVAAFFLQIQGSGRVKLDSGETIRAAYDGQNGHPYTAVGRLLVERGEIRPESLSMQSIRAWLDSNPGKAEALMNENASYVFFKSLPIGDASKGANGAQGVPLTPEASLAVDLRFHALGVPMWVEGRAPGDRDSEQDVDLRRLFVAQDTGGAIRGPVRGDVYWGSGDRAESVAGRMSHRGKLYVFLPKALAQRVN
jgi:membrane-bound lytic murein transglycosylase A